MKSDTTSEMNESAGITLIEVVVVVAIMSIALTLVGPSIGAGFRGRRLRQSVDVFSRAVGQARYLALYSREPALVMLDPARAEIQVQGGSPGSSRRYELPSDVAITQGGDESDAAEAADKDAGRPIVIQVQPDGAVEQQELRFTIRKQSQVAVLDALTGGVVMKTAR